MLEERGSGEARRLVRSWTRDREVMATIDLALPKALNAIWKHCLKVGDLDREEAKERRRPLEVVVNAEDILPERDSRRGL